MKIGIVVGSIREGRKGEAVGQWVAEQAQGRDATYELLDLKSFVTPEYNHGVPGALKNAVDSLGSEWVGKAVSLVGYGSVGGVRAIENWRTVLANFSAVVTRAELNLSTFTDWADNEFKPSERRTEELAELFTALEKAAS